MFDIKNFFGSKKVLDKGSIELIDGMICDPLLKIVNSARVSFNKEVDELSDKDLKLINYLYDHEHFSTFRHSYFSFRIKAPLFVFRQWWKYQIGSDWIENENFTGTELCGEIRGYETNWNESSGRYVEFEPEFYIPKEIRIQSENNKQGSFGKLEKLKNNENPVEFFEKSCLDQYKNYQYLVSCNAAKEQARSLLPQNIYSQCIWTCSLQCLLYAFHQRLKSDAQFEIKEYFIQLKDIVQPIFSPLEIK